MSKRLATIFYKRNNYNSQGHAFLKFPSVMNLPMVQLYFSPSLDPDPCGSLLLMILPRSRASVVVIAGRSALAGALAFAVLASGHDAVVASP